MNSALKEKAIELRKQGLSYREILTEIPVAKSTISLWLREVGLTVQQKQRLTDKKLAAIHKGGQAKHLQRLALTKSIIDAARTDIDYISDRELWLMGIMLYWAEGSKEKTWDVGTGVQFSNTDVEMIRLFLHWLFKFFDKSFEDIIIDLYIHEIQKDRTKEIANFGAQALNCSQADISHIYYKKGNVKTKRKNVGETYHGTARITVKSSSLMNRKIAGWTQGVVDYFR